MRQRARCWQNGHQLVVLYRCERRGGRLRYRIAHDTQIEFAAFDLAQDLCGGALAQVQNNIRVALAKDRQCARKQHVGRRADKADTQVAADAFGRLCGRLAQLVRMESYLPGMAEDGFTSGSQAKAAPVPDKERAVQILFKPLDRHR